MQCPSKRDPCAELYLITLFVAGSLFWLHVEKIHLTSEGGQEVQDQTMFGHLQYQHVNFIKVEDLSH